VDERSVKLVRPDDLRGFTQCHFFAGIGVWSYTLRLAGWPDDRPVWTGSCPCQSFSVAGKKKGFADERHLWPDWFRLIAECRPSVIFGEQSASKDALAWLDLVQSDLEGANYACGAVDICAASFGAPHIRQRLYFVADSEHAERWTKQQEHANIYGRDGFGRSGDLGIVADSEHRSQSERPWNTGRQNRERSSERSGSGGNSGLSQLGDPSSEGLAGWQGKRSDDGSQQPPSERTGDDVSGMADADGGQSSDGSPQRSGQHGLQPEDAGASNQDRSRQTNGHWRDADWIYCRDGKWRPVEASPQQMVDRSSIGLGRLRDSCVTEIEKEIDAISVEAQIDANSLLRDLSGALAEEAHQRKVGGIPGLHEASFLLSFLRQLAIQRWKFSESFSLQSEETSPGIMCGMRIGEALARSSRERGLDGQFSDQPANALHILSSILARHAQAEWGEAHQAYAEVGFPIGHNSQSRVARLRGYGDCIVATQAAGFIEAYLETY